MSGTLPTASNANPYSAGYTGPPTTVNLQQMADLVNNGANLVRSLAQVVQALQNPAYTFVHISGAGTTVLKSSPGTLHALIVNSFTTGAGLTLYNNTAGSGAIIGVLSFLTGLVTPFYLPHGATGTIGLTAVTTGTVDLTLLIV